MTFASVIEFGIVSFLHRHHEKMKKHLEKENYIRKSLIRSESNNQADIEEVMKEQTSEMYVFIYF